MKEAKLHFIGTPLGNRLDITLRALEMLKQLTHFFAEDSREFYKLLDLYEIPHGEKKVHSYGNHNMKEATEKALEWLRSGHNVGLVTDRGMPGISDPGSWLAERAWGEGFQVEPVPGPSAVTSLLAVCGFSADRFLFLGFLPLGPKERGEVFATVRSNGLPACFYESPKRIRETLSELKTLFPAGQVFLGREMTKVFETYSRLDLATLDLEQVMEKGEYTAVLHPGEAPVPEEAWREEIRLRMAPEKEWAKAMAARFGLGASDLYNALQRAKSAAKE
jgi:16S rRNA (cytidine1402-2'-O)-methyltransferase